MKRRCEVCGSRSKSSIYQPVFFLPDIKKPFTYDVVACRKCGFLFADNIPSQQEYETFYRNNTKYVYNENISNGLRIVCSDIFSVASSFLETYFLKSSKEIKILDVGCSIGYLLNLFKCAGFSNVLGVEPSVDCAEAAKRLYGIPVMNCPLSGFTANEKLDLIVMTGVLEHIADLNATLHKVAGLLSDKGLLLVAVPHMNKFSRHPRAPFDEFSIEHINYFSKTSLSNLAGKYHLKNVYTKNIRTEFYDSNLILAFFRKTAKKLEIKTDHQGGLAIKRYIDASEKRLRGVHKTVRYLIKSGSPVVVWGVGSLTSRLLATTDLLKAKIKFFVDSNQSLHGKTINHIQIVSPENLKNLNKGDKVFISSYIYGQEIKDSLVNKYGFKGEIVTL
jgi:2-polyprenyl-3-methyl-5-hydroxy-6-metoxy-1,4-benzoquinol methylase